MPLFFVAIWPSATTAASGERLLVDLRVFRSVRDVSENISSIGSVLWLVEAILTT